MTDERVLGECWKTVLPSFSVYTPDRLLEEFMNKGQVYEGYVERVDFPNKGIVRCEDGTAVVKNVVPGQKISFVVSRKRKGKVEGRMLSVLELSLIHI